MKIFNIRLGLAMNSSSTHSIIILPPEEAGTIESDRTGGAFGWDLFTASDKPEKELYVIAALKQSLDRIFGYINQDLVNQMMLEIYGVNDYIENEERWSEDPHIDHQSEPTLPMDWDGQTINEDFLNDFRNFLLNDRVVVLGGNDNDGEIHEHQHRGEQFTYPIIESDPQDLIARKDHENNYWVIFNRVSGAKIRLTFDLDAEIPQKSSAPELIDVKISNFCPFDCSFCYMDSTERGKHGDLMFIKALAEEFGYHQVFEVALGGGEPTLHPNFIEILKVFRDNGVVPNFTTKNLSWLRDEAQRNTIFELMGGFAYSADTAEEIQELVDIFNSIGLEDRWKRPKFTVQHVVGVNKDIQSIMEICQKEGVSLTLLGYKLDGRGDSFEPVITPENAFERILYWRERHSGWVRFGIDTLLAQQWENVLKDRVDPVFWTVREGAFSMYIDAVERTTSPSSYGNPIRLPYSVGSLKSVFKEF